MISRVNNLRQRPLNDNAPLITELQSAHRKVFQIGRKCSRRDDRFQSCNNFKLNDLTSIFPNKVSFAFFDHPDDERNCGTMFEEKDAKIDNSEWHCGGQGLSNSIGV